MFYAIGKTRKDDGGTASIIYGNCGSTRLEAELNAEAWAKEHGLVLEFVKPYSNNTGINQYNQRIFKPTWNKPKANKKRKRK